MLFLAGIEIVQSRSKWSSLLPPTWHSAISPSSSSPLLSSLACSSCSLVSVVSTQEENWSRLPWKLSVEHVRQVRDSFLATFFVYEMYFRDNI